jgi:hypothetical protein
MEIAQLLLSEVGDLDSDLSKAYFNFLVAANGLDGFEEIDKFRTEKFKHAAAKSAQIAQTYLEVITSLSAGADVAWALNAFDKGNYAEAGLLVFSLVPLAGCTLGDRLSLPYRRAGRYAAR